MLLVRFYGEHSNMWVREEDCELPPPDEGEHLCQLRAAGRQHNKCVHACLGAGPGVINGCRGVEAADSVSCP